MAMWEVIDQSGNRVGCTSFIHNMGDYLQFPDRNVTYQIIRVNVWDYIYTVMEVVL